MTKERDYRGSAIAFVLTLAALWAGIAGAASLPFGSDKLAVIKTCAIDAITDTSTAVLDANARSGSAGTNFGTNTIQNITSNTSNNRRIYIKFDLSLCSPAIPTTATVKTATLLLYMTAVPTNCRTEDVFKVTSSWTETGLTWTNQPFGTSINNPASGSRSASTLVGGAPCTYTAANQYVSWTITTDVQSWVTTPATNFGWMLRDDVEDAGSGALATYSAKEIAPTVGQSPQLLVTYVV